MTESMLAAVFRNSNGIDEGGLLVDLVEKDVPRCSGPRDVVIRVLASGVCQTDLHLIDGHDVAGVKPFVGMVLGHESAGVVIEVGADVDSVQVGEYVLCYPFVPLDVEGSAGSAPPKKGVARRTPGISHDGGFATFLLTDERCLVGVPNEESCRSLVSMTDAGLAAFNAVDSVVKHLGVQRPVVIIGLGGLGHLGIQFARALGVTTIFAIEPRLEPRQWATGTGFPHVFESVDECQEFVRTNEFEIGGVIDFVGATSTASFGIDILGFEGIYAAVGVGGEISISVAEVVERGLSIRGAFVGSFEQLRSCVNLCLAHNIRPIHREYPLSDINQALADLREGRFLGRAVVHP